MISRIWNKLFNNQTPDTAAHITLQRGDHSVSRKEISVNALKVLNRLHRADYEAYLVGGGVRDILLGLHPKDFDIATDATPEQIKRLFRNCRIIGRRFKLAHILFGHEIIEVATFRAQHQEGSKHGAAHASGMLVRDNVYGSLEEDAKRRDFTINALYYSSDNYTVQDFTGGLADLAKRQLRLIGDPITRYQEDPVRMLRAVRLAAKLDLTIEAATAKPIKDNVDLLNNVSSARLWDESHKLLLAGKAHKTYQWLNDYGLFSALFPATAKSLDDRQSQPFEEFILAALDSTDQRVAQNKPVTPAFLYSVFLWQPLLKRLEQLLAQNMSRNDAYHKAMGQVLTEQCSTIAIPKRFSLVIRDIWSLQPRLEYRTPKSFKLLEHPKFRAAYDFLVLRAKSDTDLVSIAEWWTDYQEASVDTQRKMVQTLPTYKKPKRRRNAGKKRRTQYRKPTNNQGQQ
ncbi:MAG: polynucleotide adenylyltransferase PcnB [Kangiellaceae bacterium]|jgi:poly(A) polymerase|nr:polynucleotide adenylyltransferase PcnB [Kangiellaceae bacterium]